jgi:hypothetical protein
LTTSRYVIPQFAVILGVQIKEYFCELIGSTIEASVRSVRAFVREYLVGHSWRYCLSRLFVSWCVRAAYMRPSACASFQLTSALPVAGGDH